MPNHIHAIIEICNRTDTIIIKQSGAMWSSHPTNVSGDIRTFKTLVTKDIGKSIWQSKFYDHIIRDEYDYMVHLQYIDENPAKWIEDKYYK